MGKSNTELIKIAEKHLGEGGAKFRKFAGLPAGYAWCNAFVDYIADEADDASLYFGGKRETYCPHSIQWCKKNLAAVPLYLAMAGDIIYFDWDRNGVPNHIGLVCSKKDSSSIYTIEGNTGNAVRNKTRPSKYILGVYRPRFTAKVEKGRLQEDGDFGYKSIYMLHVALSMKPSNIFTTELVKYLQRKAKATPDGSWGPKTSYAVQKNLLGFKGSDLDGAWGKKSTVELQKWINKTVYPDTTEKSSETTKPAATKKGYSGPFPELNTNAKIVNGLAYNMSYPYGTKKSVYRYKGGKPRDAYKNGLDKAYPNHKNWKNKKQKVGACCDILPGTVLGLIGIPVPKDLKDQLTTFPKNKHLKSNGHYKAADFKAGDIVQRGRKDKSGHTFIICQLVNGEKYIANAHYKKLGGTYAVMDSKAVTQKPKKWKYYKSYTVLGAYRTYYQKGDYGVDVLRIQKFLNWYGGYDIDAHGHYGDYTEECVRKFQKKVGLSGDGMVGKITIEKMKAAKK